MALNLDTTFKLKAKVEGAKSVDNFKKQLKGLDTSSKMSKVQLGKMNIEINRMARAAGNTTRGLRQHIKALQLLRDRTEIDFWWQLTFLFLSLGGLVFIDSIYSIMLYFSISFSLIYLLSFFINYKLAKL